MITSFEADAVIKGVTRHDFTGWSNYRYSRSEIIPINEQTHLEHYKDSQNILIRGVDRKYGYRGLRVISAEIIEKDGADHILIKTKTTEDTFKIEK